MHLKQDRKPRVMVVEDDPLTGDMICKALRSSGFEVNGPFTNGSQARAALLEDPDVCLIDVYLPRDDGRDLAADLIRRSDTQVILMSLEDQPGLAVPFLRKPFSLANLVQAIRAAAADKNAFRCAFASFGGL